jgi:GNAT superfamily N-acetyltransferase
MPTYEITSDKSCLDIGAIHSFLSQTYWSAGIPREVVERAIANSLCFGAMSDGEQVGFARVVTDKATFAYLADVYVLPEHRGKGLSRRLMEEIIRHRDLQGLRRMLLATRDAHGLYVKFGFKPLAAPDRIMELHDPNVYAPRATQSE